MVLVRAYGLKGASIYIHAAIHPSILAEVLVYAAWSGDAHGRDAPCGLLCWRSAADMTLKNLAQDPGAQARDVMPGYEDTHMRVEKYGAP